MAQPLLPFLASKWCTYQSAVNHLITQWNRPNTPCLTKINPYARDMYTRIDWIVTTATQCRQFRWIRWVKNTDGYCARRCPSLTDVWDMWIKYQVIEILTKYRHCSSFLPRDALQSAVMLHKSSVRLTLRTLPHGLLYTRWQRSTDMLQTDLSSRVE